MPTPTIETVINELNTWQTNSNATIATQATDVLNRFEMFTIIDTNRDSLHTLGNELERIVIDDIQSPFTETLYHVLYVIGSLFPRNNRVNDAWLDPITLEPIPSTHLFISSDRYQWSINDLVKWNKIHNPNIDANSIYINPVSCVPFNHRDTTRLKVLYLEVNQVLQPNSGFIANCCSCFFRRPPSPVMLDDRQPAASSNFLFSGLSFLTSPEIVGYFVALPPSFTTLG